MSGIDDIRAQLVNEVTNPGTRGLVEAYFRREDWRFAGELFNTLGTNDPFVIGADDLLAVGFLDEAFGAEAGFRILVQDRGAYAEMLHQIPADQDIWSEGADLSDTSPAAEMWHRLDGISGVGPVRAGKLLARKRPRLVPVWDSVVDRVVRAPRSQYWVAMQACLGDPGLRQNIQDLRPPWLSPVVPLLRVLDVAVWMRNRGSDAARRAPEPEQEAD